MEDRVFAFPASYVRFLNALVRCGGNFEAACKLAKVYPAYARRILGRKEVQAWIRDRMEEAAVMNGVTIEWWMKTLVDVVAGKRSLDKPQTKAMDLLGKALGATGDSIPGSRGPGKKKVLFMLEQDG
jgi:hypothetical protein